MLRATRRRAGNSLIEFTLVGIPTIFLLISIFEMSRGMWMYHTLASAVREGTRYAIAHGNSCNIYPNSCTSRIADVAARIRSYAVGIPPDQIENVQFSTATRTITCATLANCLSYSGTGAVYWPGGTPGAAIDVGGNRLAAVEISAQYRFRSMIAMFWPGAPAVHFGTFVLPASSRELIQY